MLASFQLSSEPQVALFSPEPLPPRERELLVFEEGTPCGESGSAGASPSQQAAPPEVPPGSRDLLLAPAKRKRRAWAPNADDHLIYRMVRLDGSGQDFVAECFGIHQSTVSRIVRRYERWEAHAEERDDGRLDPAERLRSQRWLASERNEAMLTSCLRLAGEMERCKELSKSVTRYPLRHPNQETEVRNESAVLDRTGMAARFLRLAFRINMEQVKLAEADPAPLPKPLTEEELDQQEAQAAEERAEIAAVRQQSKQEIENTERSIMDQLESARYEAEQARHDVAAAREDADEARRQLACMSATAGLPSGASSTGGPDADVSQQMDEPIMHPVHNLHTTGDANSGVSAEPAGVYATKAAADKNLESCMHTSPVHALDEPSWPPTGAPPTGKEGVERVVWKGDRSNYRE